MALIYGESTRASEATNHELEVDLVAGLHCRRALPLRHRRADKVVASNASTDSLPLVPTRHIRFDTDEGTWVSLDVSPDGRSIVFELLGDLYRMDIRGGVSQALTHGLPFDSQPRFSPDGRHIVFVSDRSGNENVWIANADGGHPHQVSRLDDISTCTSPAWPADGRLIYVSEYRAALTPIEWWNYPLDRGHLRAGHPRESVRRAAEG